MTEIDFGKTGSPCFDSRTEEKRVNCATQLLGMFEPDGPKRVSEMVTGNETWINFCGILNKCSNMMWLTKDGPDA